jgi:hypothetical protein
MLFRLDFNLLNARDFKQLYMCVSLYIRIHAQTIAIFFFLFFLLKKEI